MQILSLLQVHVVLPYRPITGLGPGAHYAMAHRSRRRQIYETAFDCRVCDLNIFLVSFYLIEIPLLFENRYKIMMFGRKLTLFHH